jgi:ligand-binding SRPBCC domain-containing protein
MIYQLKREQFLNAGLDKVWDFASSPYNLKKITPDYMDFSIKSPDLPQKIYPGMIISYSVAPLFKIKMTWVAEITHVVEKKFFVDEQRVGPYIMWHHEHFFEAHKNGVIMRDVITYKLPFGFIGVFIHWLFVKKKLNSIFDYRFQTMNKIFN